MAVIFLRKGLAALAVFVCAAMSCASGPEKTDSLFLSSDTFRKTTRAVEDIPLLESDDKTDETEVRYAFATGSRWDPKEYSLSIGNCAVVLGIAAGLGLVHLLRDRIFPYYR